MQYRRQFIRSLNDNIAFHKCNWGHVLERRPELCNQHHRMMMIPGMAPRWENPTTTFFRADAELTCWLLSSTITAVILLLHFENENTIYQLASMLGSTHEIANIVPFFVASSTSTKIRWKSGGLITLLLFPFARYIRINRQ